MAELTTDPADPRLGHGADDKPVPQNAVYLVLSEEERAKGFVRPVRTAYRHVGLRPKYALQPLTDEQHERFNSPGHDPYVKYEPYPESEAPSLGRFWTQKDLDTKGCGTVTTMGRVLSETYARDPHFYGSTYCVHCSMHKPVAEFVWDVDGERVGS